MNGIIMEANNEKRAYTLAKEVRRLLSCIIGGFVNVCSVFPVLSNKRAFAYSVDG